MITVHTVVRNEDRFIKPALLAVLSSSQVKRALVWDTGSTDKTVEQIQSIKDKRITFERRGKVGRKGLVCLRQEQLEMTKTPWFLMVDGDEVWPGDQLNKLVKAMEQASSSTVAIVNRTRNAVGDFLHYLPESAGRYRIGSWQGHLNIRAIRKVEGLTVKGEYPDEWYELMGKKIQDFPPCQDDSLERCLGFVEAWYLHVTHWRRSSSWLSGWLKMGRFKKQKWFYRLRKKKLLKMKPERLPAVLRPDRVGWRR